MPTWHGFHPGFLLNSARAVGPAWWTGSSLRRPEDSAASGSEQERHRPAMLFDKDSLDPSRQQLTRRGRQGHRVRRCQNRDAFRAFRHLPSGSSDRAPGRRRHILPPTHPAAAGGHAPDRALSGPLRPPGFRYVKFDSPGIRTANSNGIDVPVQLPRSWPWWRCRWMFTRALAAEYRTASSLAYHPA